MLAAYSANDWVNILKEIGTVVASFTALLIARAALRKSGKAQDSSNQAQTTSAVANAKVDINTERISNVAKFQDTMRSDMQNTAANSIPKEVANLLLNTSPNGGQSNVQTPVKVEGVVEVHEVGDQGAKGQTKQAHQTGGA